MLVISEVFKRVLALDMTSLCGAVGRILRFENASKRPDPSCLSSLSALFDGVRPDGVCVSPRADQYCLRAPNSFGGSVKVPASPSSPPLLPFLAIAPSLIAFPALLTVVQPSGAVVQLAAQFFCLVLILLFLAAPVRKNSIACTVTSSLAPLPMAIVSSFPLLGADTEYLISRLSSCCVQSCCCCCCHFSLPLGTSKLQGQVRAHCRHHRHSSNQRRFWGWEKAPGCQV
mmetsp:Transcript_21482/g.47975  ORF Transcript_21482/g.47975 Transcript_21482/m.47975 type:complete len:229 (-) Transcript_21482:2441-3127(-)